MTTADLVSDIEILGGRLLAIDPVAAAKTFAELNGQADAALGDVMVRRRLGQGHDKQQQIETFTRRIAARHAITVKAITGDSALAHIVHAKRHLAHTLRRRCRLSYVDIGRAMGSNHSTALRQCRAWAEYLGGKS